LCLVDREAGWMLDELAALFERLGVETRGTERARKARPMAELDERLGHEWANDAQHVATVTVDVVGDVEEAITIANDETSGLAASIVAEDEAIAQRFLDGYRGTAAFWQATTRFTDGFALTGAPETGINVDWTPGPRGPVTYRDLWLRQYRVIGDGTQTR
jgi:glutamate-5-semialdehyde dehydrogenase